MCVCENVLSVVVQRRAICPSVSHVCVTAVRKKRAKFLTCAEAERACVYNYIVFYQFSFLQLLKWVSNHLLQTLHVAFNGVMLCVITASAEKLQQSANVVPPRLLRKLPLVCRISINTAEKKIILIIFINYGTERKCVQTIEAQVLVSKSRAQPSHPSSPIIICQNTHRRVEPFAQRSGK